jgi:hypothetical protein
MIRSKWYRGKLFVLSGDTGVAAWHSWWHLWSPLCVLYGHNMSVTWAAGTHFAGRWNFSSLKCLSFCLKTKNKKGRGGKSELERRLF